MRPTINIDDRQWKQAARDLFRTSSRSCVDFTNGQALKVVIEAIRRTKFVTSAKIRADINEDPRTKYRLWNAAMRKMGAIIPRGSSIKSMVSEWVKRRIASGSFIRSGWIPAQKRLWNAVMEKPARVTQSFSGAKVIGKPRGYANPGRFTLSSKIIAEIANTAIQDAQPPSKGTASSAMRIAEQGLQSALDYAAKDMIETLAKRLKKDLGKYNAGVAK